MSNRTLIELNHDYCPRDENLLAWARALQAYIRSGDKSDLPQGVTFKRMRHHSEPDPIEQIQAKTEPKKYVRVERHIPGLFSDVPDDDRVVTSIEEMYALPYLRAWENEPTFKRWECYTEGTEPRLLMAVMKDGKFWVAAYVWGDKLESLPRWKEQ